MKLQGCQVFALLFCIALSASETYVVVRLVDPARRDAIVRSGAVEVSIRTCAPTKCWCL